MHAGRTCSQNVISRHSLIHYFHAETHYSRQVDLQTRHLSRMKPRKGGLADRISSRGVV